MEASDTLGYDNCTNLHANLTALLKTLKVGPTFVMADTCERRVPSLRRG